MKKNYFNIKSVILIATLHLLFFGFATKNNVVNFSTSTYDSLELYRNYEITKEEIYYHVKYLASDELEGRKAGTEGDALARNYISSEFYKYGLEPAGDSSYLQFFPIKAKLKAGKNNRLSFEYNSINTDLVLNEDFYPYSLSDNTKAEGELVFIGYGINSSKYNDYLDINGKMIDVKGKILLFYDDVPESKNVSFKGDYKYSSIKRKINSAISSGASGIIIIYDLSDEKGNLNFPNLTPPENNETKYPIPVVYAKQESIYNILKQIDIDLKNIQNKIIESQNPNSFYINNLKVKIETEIVKDDIISSNIIGYLKGSDPVLNKEVIVIGAHYDHLGYGFNFWNYEDSGNEIHNGADDNASGTTGVLELAQKISFNRNNFKRSFLFMCFGAEEMGLLGSSYFTNSKLFNNYNIVAMINLDMIGRLDNNSLIINGTKTSNLWVQILDSINNNYKFKTTYIPEGYGGSDHTSFTLKKIPTLFFFTGIHDDYHQPSDDYWKINTTGEEKVLNFVYDVVSTISNTANSITFADYSNKKEEKNEEKVKVEVYFGTIPDFSYDAKGYKISGVKNDSPSEKAGLIAGDIIIKFGNDEINDIYDFTKALSKYKPGDEVEIVFLREGNEYKVKATLGSK